MLCDDLNGKEIQVRGIYVYTFIYIADSLGSTAETNTALETSYTPVRASLVAQQ